MRNPLYLFLLLALLVPAGRLAACDACGCSLSQAYLGLTPLQSGHYLGVWWQHQYYRTYGDPEFSGPSSGAGEYFNSVELRGRYHLSDRLQFLGIVPYMHHIRSNAGTRRPVSGLGDVVAMAIVTAFDTSDSLARKVRHRLAAGIGGKAPTGKFHQPGPGEVVNPNFQVGTGSWDALFNLSYTARMGNWGASLDGTWRLNSTNSADYRFGSRLMGAAGVFRLNAVGKTQLMTNAALLYEDAAWDVESGYFRTNTGGAALFATLGAEWYWNRYNIGVNCSLPLDQDWNNGLVEARARASLHFTFFM
ncbi:MAG: hypothetical protein KDD10_00790 [Phaeodactylibacter sp.]|nr:hypothetical protein [Phaeodactylibacter sp.]